MKFIFIIGAEGSGHQLMRDILEPYLKSHKVFDQGTWHSVLAKLATIHESNADCFLDYYKQLETTLRSYKLNNEEKNLFDTASFPFGERRDTLRRFDITKLVEALQKVGIEPKFIVTYRNPIRAAYSGYRRGFTNNILEQARIVEDNLNYIHSQLSNPHLRYCYKCIDFDYLLRSVDAHMGSIKQYLGINFDSWGVEKRIKKQSDIPGDIKDLLEQFFIMPKISIWKDWVYDNYIEMP